MWPGGNLAGVMDGRITFRMYMVRNIHACSIIVAPFPSLRGIFSFNALARLPFFATKYSFDLTFICFFINSFSSGGGSSDCTTEKVFSHHELWQSWNLHVRERQGKE